MAEDVERITELFAAYGTVSVRRMFSGAGVFSDGLMIALSVGGVIFLKADARTIPDFEREGEEPFSYRTKEGRRVLASYWRMPKRLYDEPEELAEWARRAMECARRAGAKAAPKPAGRSKRKRR